MKISGMAFLGMGILLFIVGILMIAGVMIVNIPLLGWIAYIPLSVGGILIVVGIVLLVIKR